MNVTDIAYLTHTWNPIVMRCTRVSPGCDNCWHLLMARRLAANPKIPANLRAAYAGETGPLLVESRLAEPLQYKKSLLIGVQFMGDLFHPGVSEEMLWAVIEMAYTARHHTFLILTKRPARMLDVLTRSAWWNNDTPSNIWLGVTAENQHWADARRDVFADVPAAAKVVSYEPALGVVNWAGWEFVDWMISGAETGARARPSHPHCFTDLRDFCQAHKTAYFHKQNGLYRFAGSHPVGTPGEFVIMWPNGGPLFVDQYPRRIDFYGGAVMKRVSIRERDHLVDGVEWRQMPGELGT